MENKKNIDNGSKTVMIDIQKQKMSGEKKAGLFLILEVENKYGTRW